MNDEFEKMDPAPDPIPDEENPPFERVEQEVAALVKEYASKNQKIIFDSYSSFFVDTEQPPVPEPDPLPEDYVPPKVEVPLEQ